MTKKHVWRIKKEYFRQLKSGAKTLEIRVGYPAVKKVKTGDVITFENYGPNAFVVDRISVYDGFSRMLEGEVVERVLPGMTKVGALNALRAIYPAGKESLGVYVFELRNLEEKPPVATFFKASQLLKDQNNSLFSKLVAESYTMTDWISEDYPDHVDHFYSKYVPGIFDGSREIISCYSGSPGRLLQRPFERARL